MYILQAGWLLSSWGQACVLGGHPHNPACGLLTFSCRRAKDFTWDSSCSSQPFVCSSATTVYCCVCRGVGGARAYGLGVIGGSGPHIYSYKETIIHGEWMNTFQLWLLQSSPYSCPLPLNHGLCESPVHFIGSPKELWWNCLLASH